MYWQKKSNPKKGWLATQLHKSHLLGVCSLNSSGGSGTRPIWHLCPLNYPSSWKKGSHSWQDFDQHHSLWQDRAENWKGTTHIEGLHSGWFLSSHSLDNSYLINIFKIVISFYLFTKYFGNPRQGTDLAGAWQWLWNNWLHIIYPFLCPPVWLCTLKWTPYDYRGRKRALLHQSELKMEVITRQK